MPLGAADALVVPECVQPNGIKRGQGSEDLPLRGELTRE